jgi:hypothetical protein
MRNAIAFAVLCLVSAPLFAQQPGYGGTTVSQAPEQAPPPSEEGSAVPEAAGDGEQGDLAAPADDDTTYTPEEMAPAREDAASAQAAPARKAKAQASGKAARRPAKGKTAPALKAAPRKSAAAAEEKPVPLVVPPTPITPFNP